MIEQANITAGLRIAAIEADEGVIAASRLCSSGREGASQSEMRLARQEYLAEFLADFLERHRPTLPLVLEWRDGAPPKPWRDEWFIAKTTYGDRVVLRSLPDDWTYDFKTADDTYIMADKIAKWMQFPDSDFTAPENERPPATPKEDNPDD